MIKLYMKTFEKIKSDTFYFNSCEGCEAKCCDGRFGSLFAQITLEDFEKVYEIFPILFIYGELNFLKPVILLTNGKSLCKYNKDFKCTIYEKRPSICKNYPLSAHLDNSIYIDKSCPALNSNNGLKIVEDGQIKNNFNNYDFHNYQEKYIKMHFYFDKFNKKNNLKPIIFLNNVQFYSFKNNLNDYYIELQIKSLKNIDTYYNI
ncbi:zinc/iron-chelating domain-containing protein [Malaciobacter molluscorum LMG 25693]|uniref:YkgJ family cysteine cluster protein n=2 Tax=Malaciobacter molluscorum TaxID=1032072 RepID=A0A2G1DGM1_9BACT|nr:YkgJ family cysteine cluster protein [Malaciobacter molluscorum LMG 25693]PHO17590.1 zinc/iron-chelating domain-containing protein [Malaciobacter molluscorum LMG 25693]